MSDAPENSDVLAVVAIGASAGGLATIKRLFEQVPSDSGIAFVVIMHLSPDHESFLADLLQLNTKIPVGQVQGTVKLEPNRVYVIPPGFHLNSVDTHLKLSEPQQNQKIRAPIDHFFMTLARTHDGHAVGIILSGTGSDGSLGLRHIKEKGGLTIVQDPAEAEFPGMPQSALAAGSVDLVLGIEKMLEPILRFVKAGPLLPSGGEEALAFNEKQTLQQILAEVKRHTGRDFSRYKQATLLRRTRRRMQLYQIDNFADYLRFMQTQSSESHALSDEFLIPVTQFFRDSEAFQVLQEKILPAFIQRKRPDVPFRIWSVGCATGEEAYSLAMLILEQVDDLKEKLNVQIFASDIHNPSLQFARDARYPKTIEAFVSEARLKEFFIKFEGGYQVHPRVRDLVVFTSHNLLSDPPFSKLDLVVCRNLLIYMERNLQKDIIQLFHYALNQEGILLLGQAESLNQSDLFEIVNKEHSFYRKRPVDTADLQLPVFAYSQRPQELGTKQEKPQADPNTLSYQTLHQQLLEQIVPPSLIISSNNNIVHLSGNAGRYLQPVAGEMSTSVFRQVRQELQEDIQIAIYMAREQVQPILTKNIKISLDGQPHSVSMEVRPVLEPNFEDFLLVVFNSYELSKDQAPQEETERGHAGLESELSLSQQKLEALARQFHRSREEMRYNNEELQSSNEELRATLEELETSKEELQSLNEELVTVNQENRHKVEELGQVNSDLQNLLSSTQVATLFLDRSLRIMRFTPAVGKLFSIRDIDRGRPLAELSHRLGYQSLIEDAETVLKTLSPFENEILSGDGTWFLTRLMPYRTIDDRIGGVILTFIDITERKEMEDELKAKQTELANDLGLSHKIHSLSGKMLSIQTLHDEEALQQLSASISDLFGAYLSIILIANESQGSLKAYAHHQVYAIKPQTSSTVSSSTVSQPHLLISQRAYTSGETIQIEDSLNHPDSELNDPEGPYRAFYALPLKRQNHEVMGVLSIFYHEAHQFDEKELGILELLSKLILSMLDRLKAETALRNSEQRLRLLIDGPLDYAIIALDLDGNISLWNHGAEELFGYRNEQIIGKSFNLLFSPEDVNSGVPKREMETALLEGSASDERWLVRQDGSKFFASGILTCIVTDGKAQEFVKIMRNLTEEKARAEEREQQLSELDALNKDFEKTIKARNRELVFSELRFRQAFEAGPMAACMTTLGTEKILEVNAAFLKLTGYERSEVIGKTNTQLALWATPKDQQKLSEPQNSQGFSGLELQIRTKEDQILDILASAELLKFDHEEVWLKMFVDITDRKRTEEELGKAINKVISNTNWFSEQIVQRLANTFTEQPESEAPALEELTPREREVLGHIATGHSNEEIAETLGIRLQTVRNYVTNIYSKLGVHSRSEAVIWARKRGIISEA